MRTKSERDYALVEIEKAVKDDDVMMVRVLLELCRRIEEASERIADAHGETTLAIDSLSESLARQLKQVVTAR
jgi:hypothetical protein